MFGPEVVLRYLVIVLPVPLMTYTCVPVGLITRSRRVGQPCVGGVGPFLPEGEHAGGRVAIEHDDGVIAAAQHVHIVAVRADDDLAVAFQAGDLRAVDVVLAIREHGDERKCAGRCIAIEGDERIGSGGVVRNRVDVFAVRTERQLLHARKTLNRCTQAVGLALLNVGVVVGAHIGAGPAGLVYFGHGVRHARQQLCECVVAVRAVMAVGSPSSSWLF